MTVRIVAPLVALVIFSATASAALAQNLTCTGERWLPPRALQTREGYTLFMERPSIVPMRGELFLPAWPTTTYDSIGTIVWPLAPSGAPSSVDQIPLGVLVDRSGIARLVPWPTHIVAGPWFPVGAADDSGIGHVIWGSRDNVPMSSIFMVRSLWYARFDGRGWSEPARVLSTEGTILWSSAFVSPLVAHGSSLHLVVATLGEGLWYVRFTNGMWTDRRISIPSVYAGYPRLAVLSSGRLVLAVQGDVAHPPASGVSGIYTTRSDDAGERWSTPTPISTVEEGPAFDARLVADDRDVLYAFWYQQTDKQGHPATGVTLGGSPGRIYATQSFDRGVTWERPKPTPLIENANELQVLLRRDHSVLTVVADGVGEHMLINGWSNDWRSFTAIDAGPAPLNPSFGMDDAQRPFLSWAIRRTHDWLGTMATALVPCR